MDPIPRLLDLVVHYEEMQERGNPVTPEDLCLDTPELLEPLRKKLADLAALRARGIGASIATTPSPGSDYSTLSSGSGGGDVPPLAMKVSSTVSGLRFHARGGMGEVYEAHDDALGRRVAVKLIQAHCRHQAERFLVEAEVTSRLDHPGIAPVHGVGRLADGRPYYTMRFIQGKTLRAAIQEFHVGLTPDFGSLAFRQLLQQFIAVCNTIAYAHSRGILHCDVKPGNVMLGKYGETLVVDWGLARPVERTTEERKSDAEDTVAERRAESDATRTGQFRGTWAYVSPEQAAGRWRAVGRPSDVYSLGATLYEVLTGRVAFDGNDVAEVQQKIQRGEYLKPREVNRQAPRALEAVCLKAMAVKPEDRYQTATELGEEVDRWLADEMIRAWVEPLTRRARRWMRKHRPLVTGAVAVLLMATIGSIAGMVVVGGFNQRLDAAYHQLTEKNSALETSITSEKAERQRAKLALDFFVSSLRRPDPSVDGKKVTVYELLDTTVKDIDASTTLDGQSRHALLKAIGQTYGGLGEYAEAVSVLEIAQQLAQAELGNEHVDTLDASNSLAIAYEGVGKLDLAIPLLERTLATASATLGDQHVVTLHASNSLASAYRSAGKLDVAIALYERTLAGLEATLGPDHEELRSARHNLGSAYSAAGKLDLGIPMLERTLKDRETKLGNDHPATLSTRNNLARAYERAGQSALAIELLRQTTALQETKLGPDHPSTLASLNNLGLAYQGAGQFNLAIPLFEKVLKAREVKLGEEHPSTWESRASLASAYQDVGKVQLAIALYQRTLTAQTAQLGEDHPETLNTCNNLATAYLDAGKSDQAVALLERVLKASEIKLGEDHPDTLITRSSLASLYARAGKFDLAIPLLERALKVGEAKRGDDHPDTLSARSNLAGAYYVAGKLDLAIPLLERTLKDREAMLGDDHPNTLVSRNNLAQAYQRSGKLDLAIPLLERTLKAFEAKLGDDHPNTLTARNNLAGVYHDAGKTHLAIPLLERTLKAKEAVMGSDHPSTLGTRHNVANTYLAAGKLHLAITMLEPTLNALEAKLGAEHPDTLACRNTLASAYLDAGRRDLAIPLFEQTLQSRAAKLGDDHPDTLQSRNNLAMAYKTAGKLDVAIALYERTLVAYEAKLGDEHPRTVSARGNLATAYLEARRPTEAIKLYEKYLADQRTRLATEPARWASVLTQVATYLLQAKQFAAAESCLRECLTVRAKLEPDAWTTFNTKSMLGEALLGQQNYAEAEPLLVSGHEGMQRDPAIGKHHLTNAIKRLIKLYEDTGKADEAAKWRAQLPLGTRMLEMLERDLTWNVLWGRPGF